MLTIAEIKEIVSEYFQNLPISEVHLFGSYSRGEQTEDSDIDIMIWRDKNSIHLPDLTTWHADLEYIFQCEVDLRLAPDGWHDAPKHGHKLQIEQDLQLLYSKESFQTKTVL